MNDQPLASTYAVTSLNLSHSGHTQQTSFRQFGVCWLAQRHGIYSRCDFENPRCSDENSVHWSWSSIAVCGWYTPFNVVKFRVVKTTLSTIGGVHRVSHFKLMIWVWYHLPKRQRYLLRTPSCLVSCIHEFCFHTTMSRILSDQI